MSGLRHGEKRTRLWLLLILLLTGLSSTGVLVYRAERNSLDAGRAADKALLQSAKERAAYRLKPPAPVVSAAPPAEPTPLSRRNAALGVRRILLATGLHLSSYAAETDEKDEKGVLRLVFRGEGGPYSLCSALNELQRELPGLAVDQLTLSRGAGEASVGFTIELGRGRPGNSAEALSPAQLTEIAGLLGFRPRPQPAAVAKETESEPTPQARPAVPLPLRYIGEAEVGGVGLVFVKEEQSGRVLRLSLSGEQTASGEYLLIANETNHLKIEYEGDWYELPKN